MPRPLVLLALAAACGCGPPAQAPDPPAPSSGVVVRLDGEPLAGATLMFLPTGDGPASGGGGFTGPDGRYQVFDRRGNPGLPPGSYRVTVSLRKKPDGTPVPVNTPDAIDESESAESIPPRYSVADQTVLKVEIGKDGATADLDHRSTKPRK